MRPLSHIQLAHLLWKQHLRPGDNAIDATCGRGKDSLWIAQACLTEEKGFLIGMDIQEEALTATRSLLHSNLAPEQFQRISLLCQSHCQFPAIAFALPVRLIVYNLGYLPGGDKDITTQTAHTLQSIETAVEILAPGGLISITCYPGHPEGKKEKEEILKRIDSNYFKGVHASTYHSLSAPFAPSIVFLEKKDY